ncbi:MAG: exodeoxyribonuclease VII large subunit [Calditrichaeota bacterium]|nr:MAG: exodeoxyribonuclease VII large subunit [Calditrichota bacterium]
MDNVLTVSEITREIKFVLEDTFKFVMVEGQISNLTKAYSGHIYFSLKDEKAQIDCVIWKNTAQKLLALPKIGNSVVLQGQITLYEKSGRYQISVWNLFEKGVGSLQQQFEEMKAKLLEEGLFEPERKQPLPNFPMKVGIVTSPTGAVIHDIHTVFKKNAPCVKLFLAPVKVQGEGSANEIAKAIRKFNKLKNVDALIVGRGGGSLEELWSFNEEIVARAIAESEIPIISSVGHEVDFTISDFVADRRAATPTAAAEVLSENFSLVRDWLFGLENDLKNKTLKSLEQKKEELNFYRKIISKDRIFSKFRYFQQTLDNYENVLRNEGKFAFEKHKNQLDSLQKQLENLSPDSVLSRGFSICTNENGVVLNSVRNLKVAEKVNLNFKDGKAQAEILNLENK